MGSLGIVPNLGQIYNPDSFTGDGSEVNFTLTHLVTSDQSIIWVEGGVIQKPGIDFTISGLTLTRTTAPANLVACFAMYLGVSMDIGVPSDGTVTLAKMAVNSVDSDQYVDGSIDAVHMSANSIDSDQYVDGSIDEAHIANDAIDFAAHLKTGTDGELITWDASGNAAAVPVGTATHVLTSGGTGVAPTFQAAAAGGDTRNFIIDGDFTQWPEGNKTNQTTNVYGPALWRQTHSTSSANMDMTQSTTVPTFAQSSHTSKFSFLIDVGSVADATPSTNDLKLMRYFVTGSDYTYLHSKEVTLAFWVKGSTIGQYGVAFKNSATNRGYITSFSLAVADTWEYKTITVTLDTTGTWLFTEADIGLIIEFQFLSGDNRLTSSPGSWQAENKFGSSGQVNMMALTTNNIAFSQVGLYLGATAPTFLGESVATINDQVGYYIERYGHATAQRYMNVGWGYSTTSPRLVYHYTYKKRTAAPTTTISGDVYFGGHATSSETFNTKSSSRVMIYCVASSIVVNEADEFHLNGGAYITIDSRH